jgi:hypothetical protein
VKQVNAKIGIYHYTAIGHYCLLFCFHVNFINKFLLAAIPTAPDERLLNEAQ